jgi:hypothetical protein
LSVELVGRKQKAVYWELLGRDGYGKPKFDEPVEKIVRWKANQRAGSDAKGNPITIAADLVVDFDVVVGSYFWLGGLDDMPGTSLTPESNLMRVETFTKDPDIKGRNFMRTATLSRANDAPPTLL